MQSPFLGDMSTEVETWSSSLQQVEEITDLWYTCQKKVNELHNEPEYKKTNKMICVPSRVLDQPGYSPSLIKSAVHLKKVFIHDLFVSRDDPLMS